MSTNSKNKKPRISHKRVKENVENFLAHNKCVENRCAKKSEDYDNAISAFLILRKGILSKLNSKQITTREAKAKLYDKEIKLVKSNNAKEYRKCLLKSCQTELVKKYIGILEKDLHMITNKRSKIYLLAKKYLHIFSNNPTEKDLLAYEIDKLKIIYKN
jgi:hypothetical protein